MKIALLRVGVDTGSGGIHGPLFSDGSFEFIPIPDKSGTDERKYGNTINLKKKRLIEYFPKARHLTMANKSIHFDPEFTTFTYGDPTSPKAALRKLEVGDMLIFYCGLEGWEHKSEPALYLIGYFEVAAAGKADTFDSHTIRTLFANNYHVRHHAIFERQRKDLVLIKGSEHSRLLKNAVCISVLGRNRLGQPLKVLSPEMQRVFGTFNGRLSFQRSPPRWVDPAYVTRAAGFMRSLE